MLKGLTWAGLQICESITNTGSEDIFLAPGHSSEVCDLARIRSGSMFFSKSRVFLIDISSKLSAFFENVHVLSISKRYDNEPCSQSGVVRTDSVTWQNGGFIKHDKYGTIGTR